MILITAVAIGLGVFACNKTPTPGGTATPEGTRPTAGQVNPNSPVAMLDPDAIYKLPEFTDVNKKLDEKVKELEKQLEDKLKGKKVSKEEQELEKLKMTQELESYRSKLQYPLNRKVHNAIGQIAKEKHFDVVLDKRIVVLGVPDITDEVKNRFQQDKSTPDASATSEPDDQVKIGEKSTVGYVDQNEISDLKMFRDAEQELVKYYRSLTEEFNKKAAKLSAVEKGQLEQDMQQRFMQKKDELYAPLQSKVNDVIAQVSKEDGLSLVLDTHQVMWGGRNLTTDVTERLIKGKS